MFGTLRLGSDEVPAEFVEYAQGEEASLLGANVFSHSACDNCRLKKLRCNGRRSGCDRCRSKSLECKYETATDSKRSRLRSRQQLRNNHFIRDTTGLDVILADTAEAEIDQGSDSSTRRWSGVEAHRASNNAPFIKYRKPRSLPNAFSHEDDAELGGFGEDLDLNAMMDADDPSNDLYGHLSRHHPDHIQTQASMNCELRGFCDPSISKRNKVSTDSILGTLGLDGNVLDDATDLDFCTSGAQSFLGSDFSRGLSPVSSKLPTATPSPDAMSLATFGRPRPRTDAQNCHCLESLLQVLEEIEASILSVSSAKMHILLSFQSKAVGVSDNVLTCRFCTGRFEYIALLAIVGEKTTSLSEGIVSAFVNHMQERNDVRSSRGPRSTNKDISDEDMFRLGEFVVVTHKEVTILSATVIRLQLKRLVAFVSRTQTIAASISRPTQAQALGRFEKILTDLITKMQKVASDIESGLD